MSPDTKIQRLTRARMAHTGEKYTTALRAILADGPVPQDLPPLEPDHEHVFNPVDAAADDPVELVWPTGLAIPPRPPQLIYLDLLHWVSLAKAAKGHPDGNRHVPALAAARQAKDAGKALFPLSGAHYMEVAKIRNRRHRADLAAIMEELSDFTTLASRSVIMRLELETALDSRLGIAAHSLGPVPLLGMGANHSVGVMGEISYSPDPRSSGREDARLRTLRLLSLLSPSQRMTLEREVLAGPQDDQTEVALTARGWDPRAAQRTAQARAELEQELVSFLDADTAWRTGRLRDVVCARELANEALDMLTFSVTRRGAGFDGLFDDQELARRFIRCMPSMEVAIEMKTHYHRNSQTRWDVNTIFDVDAMSTSVPYCDAVVTERNAAHTLNRVHIGVRMHTAIMATPEEMVAWLAGLA
jgi:hypothetical protein